MKNGFTIIELLVVLTVFIALIGLGYINIIGIERRAPITATVNTFIGDLRGQQTKAMTGVAQGSFILAVSGTSYSIDSSVVALPENVTIVTTFPGSVITFTKGSGDISGFSSGNDTVTVTQTLSGEHKIITINRYGAVTQIQ